MDQIFVQIASYRDVELPLTIDNCIRQARHSDRITFGICWQYDESTLTDLDQFRGREGFRVEAHYFTESRGCCWARSRTNSLYENETFTLQIDAHTRFAPDWDVDLIAMLNAVDSTKPIISTYPAPYEVIDNTDVLRRDRGIQCLKLGKLRRDLTTKQTTATATQTLRPGRSPLLAAGMIFTRGEFCDEVPYDPHMYFSGEEISLAARAFTSGYDFYYPSKDVVWHLYHHKMPLHWSDHQSTQSASDKRAKKRLQSLLLDGGSTLKEYGLGTVRSLSEFEKTIGVSFHERFWRKKQPVLFTRTLSLDVTKIDDRDDYLYWIFSLLDEDDQEIYRFDIADTEILRKKEREFTLEASVPDRPYRYALWPYSEELGYMKKLYFPVD